MVFETLFKHPDGRLVTFGDAHPLLFPDYVNVAYPTDGEDVDYANLNISSVSQEILMPYFTFEELLAIRKDAERRSSKQKSRADRKGKLALYFEEWIFDSRAVVNQTERTVWNKNKSPQRLHYERISEVRYAFSLYAGHFKLRRVFNGFAGRQNATSFAVRGEIKEFSRRSRKRFIDRLSACRNFLEQQARDGHSQCYFVTLTYHTEDQWLPDLSIASEAGLEPYQLWKAHLEAFFKRMKRRFPNFAAFWRLELQERGSPHYHLLIFGVPSQLKIFNIIQATCWNAIVSRVHGDGGERDLKHFRVAKGRNACVYMRDRDHASVYLAKYMTKPTEAGVKLGRRWGVVGDLDLSLSYSLNMSQAEYQKFMRLCQQWLESIEDEDKAFRVANALRSGSGLTLYGYGDAGNKNSPRAAPIMREVMRRTNVALDIFTDTIEDIQNAIDRANYRLAGLVEVFIDGVPTWCTVTYEPIEGASL